MIKSSKPGISETLEKVSVLTTFAQSWSVLGLNNPKFSSLKESQSRQLTNSVSQKVSVSTTFNFDFYKKLSFYG